MRMTRLIRKNKLQASALRALGLVYALIEFKIMKLNICIAGATGWVGKPLCLAVSATDDLSLVGAVSRTHKGRNLKDAIPESKLDLTVSGSVAEALDTPTDVLVWCRVLGGSCASKSITEKRGDKFGPGRET